MKKLHDILDQIYEGCKQDVPDITGVEHIAKSDSRAWLLFPSPSPTASARKTCTAISYRASSRRRQTLFFCHRRGLALQ